MKRATGAGLPLASLILLVLLPTLSPVGAASRQATVQPRVWDLLQNKGQAQILVVLHAQADLNGASALPTKEARGRYVFQALRVVAEESQRGLRAVLDANGADYQPFYIVNALRVRADEALVRRLAARPEVDRIMADPWIKGLPDPLPATSGNLPAGIESSLIRVHADDVWALGYRGQGIVIAGQDTGYDWDHPALIDQYRGWDGVSADHDYNWHDAIHENNSHTAPGNPCGFNSAEPCDDHGHGTHTMGTMAGDDGGTNQIGMAPEARWIGCRNMEEGWGTPSTYMECFEFFLAPYPLGGTPDGGVPELAPHVVSNSWGCPPEEGCDAEAIALLEESVQALYQAGIVVVASAGNSGSACDSVLSPPAIYPQSFTVGAFDHTTGLIASFSSRGPVTYGGDTYIKPDITAPGVKIRSSLPGGGYGDKQGTSMAAPHVAGAVALLLSAAPGYVGDVDGIELVLTSTAEPRTTTQGCGGDGTASVPNNVWGWGILDILAAVELATVGQLGGTVTDAISGLPIDGALVTAELDLLPTIRHEVTTDLSGTYTLTLPAGVYQVSADAGGYAAQKVAGVVVAGGEVTYQDLALQPVLSYYLPLWSNNP